MILRAAAPPTPRAYRSSLRAAGISPEYRTWRDAAGWEAKTQLIGVKPIKGPFTVKIEVPVNRRDLDNHCKPLLDLCQAVGAIQDDKFAEEIHLYRVDRDGALVTLVAL